jgi:hypothetical protein
MKPSSPPEVLRAFAVWLAVALGTATAQAAGGHHAVDDAAILLPGQCQAEAWLDRERGGARTLAHFGPACRVGAVELGLNVDRERGERTTTFGGAQFKWATELRPGLAAGLAASIAAPDRRPRHLFGNLLVPVSWQASDALLVHANLGRDLVQHGASSSRAGLALEWSATPTWTFIGERFREAGSNRWRVGARWVLSPTVSLDLSRADAGHAGPPPWWSLGVSWLFEP